MFKRFSFTSLALVFLYGCGEPAPSSNVAARTAPVELRLVDAPAEAVTEIVVTIDKVTAHEAGGGWTTLAETKATVDLLKLQGGTFQTLGVAALPAGRITQLRLYVDPTGPNYVTTPDGVQHPLKVPSGPQSGIKIKGDFDWSTCAGGNITIDFDGKKSIFTHPKGAGAGDEWILRPVIRVKSVHRVPATCDGDDGQEPIDAGAPVDAGSAPAPAPDAGTLPPPPPVDPCATMECADICIDGACVVG